MPALPKRYYYMFWLVEPFLTILGAGYAIFLPEKYASSLLPETVERSTIGIGATTRGQMVIGALGSCFFLIAMISFSLFPVIQSLPESPTKVSLVKALLIPLAIADLSHIVVTLIPLPISLFKSPANWTGLIHGNVTITIILFLVRMGWFLGIGIPSTEGTTPKRRRLPGSYGQVTVPLPPISPRWFDPHKHVDSPNTETTPDGSKRSPRKRRGRGA